jgi:hypothetical protein
MNLVSFRSFTRHSEDTIYSMSMTTFSFLAGIFMLAFLLFLAGMVLTIIYELFFKPFISDYGN